MGTKYTLRIDDGAFEKFLGHVEFLSRVSVPASERLYDDVIKRLHIIALDPECYSRYWRASPADVTLRYALCGKKGRYRIVFGIIGDTIRVYDIQDCRQDIDKSLV